MNSIIYYFILTLYIALEKHYANTLIENAEEHSKEKNLPFPPTIDVSYSFEYSKNIFINFSSNLNLSTTCYHWT